MALMPSMLFDQDFFSPFLRGYGGDMTTAGGGQGIGSLPARTMPLDVSETDESYELKADIPGVNKSDIKLQVDHDVLRINVERAEEREEDKDVEGRRYHRVERSTYFSGRALRMPDRANLDAIKASYENGVLKLHVPKKTPEQAGIKSITID